ncbi:MAG: hypothetical protein QM651_06510 [Rhodoblastus sp.]
MKRGRSIVGVIAMLCVLLNAALVVRHAATVIEARLEQASTVAAPGVICHGDGTITTLADSELPSVPQPANKQKCPVCMGMCPTGAILAETPMLPRQEIVEVARVAPPDDFVSSYVDHFRPPPRGPPQIA